MFSKSGVRRFEQCGVKTIKIENRYKHPDSKINSWSRADHFPDGTKGMELGLLAVLDCPKTSADVQVKSQVFVGNKLDAMENLGEIAGSQVCGTCPYYKLPPVAVRAAEHARIVEETELIRLETERMKAKADHDRIVEELGRTANQAIEQ